MLTCEARCMRILTAIALFDEAGPSLYKSNEISEWLARPGQADGYRLMYGTEFKVQRSLC